jgi:hypothetical protein
MAQKEALLARIEAQIGAEPVSCPPRPIRRRTSTARHGDGRLGGEELPC